MVDRISLVITLFAILLIGCENKNTIVIGNKVWMSEDLNVMHYQNGDEIPEAKNGKEWFNYSMNEKGCWSEYESFLESGKKYGKFYNWYAVHDPRGLAPKGWHIPTNEEWTSLIMDLGGSSTAGNRIKSKSSCGDNEDATNESGFNGLPNGMRSIMGEYMFFCDYYIW